MRSLGLASMSLKASSIRGHEGVLNGHILGHEEEIGVRVIHVVVLGENAVLLHDELEAGGEAILPP